MRLLTITFILTAAVGFVLSPFAYAVGTKGAWRRSADGWHFMSYMGVFALVMMLAVWSILWGPLPMWVRMLTWASIAAVAWWRLILLIRTGRDARRAVRLARRG